MIFNQIFGTHFYHILPKENRNTHFLQGLSKPTNNNGIIYYYVFSFLGTFLHIGMSDIYNIASES